MHAVDVTVQIWITLSWYGKSGVRGLDYFTNTHLRMHIYFINTRLCKGEERWNRGRHSLLFDESFWDSTEERQIPSVSVEEEKETAVELLWLLWMHGQTLQDNRFCQVYTINSFNYNFMCILHVAMYVHKQLIILIPHDEFDFIFHHDFCNLYIQCTVDIEHCWCMCDVWMFRHTSILIIIIIESMRKW